MYIVVLYNLQSQIKIHCGKRSGGASKSVFHCTNWSFDPFCSCAWTYNQYKACEEGDCLFITNSFLLTGSVFVESRVDSRGDYSYMTDPGEVWPRKNNMGGHRTLPPGQENISHFKILQSNVFSKSYLHHQKWDFLQIRIHMHRKVMPASKSPEPDRETKGRFSTGVRRRQTTSLIEILILPLDRWATTSTARSPPYPATPVTPSMTQSPPLRWPFPIFLKFEIFSVSQTALTQLGGSQDELHLNIGKLENCPGRQ